jgi:hypothetical protein
MGLTLLKELKTVRRELRKADPHELKFPDTSEIVLDELLTERGGRALFARRKQRILDGSEPTE